MVVLIYVQHLSMFLEGPFSNLLNCEHFLSHHSRPMNAELRPRMVSLVEKSRRAWFFPCHILPLSMNCVALMFRSGAAHGSLDAGCHTSQLIAVP